MLLEIFCPWLMIRGAYSMCKVALAMFCEMAYHRRRLSRRSQDKPLVPLEVKKLEVEELTTKPRMSKMPQLLETSHQTKAASNVYKCDPHCGGGSPIGPSELSRGTWLRSSLRKSPKSNHHGSAFNRRWTSLRAPSGTRRPGVIPPSSAAVANQLFRTSSFNSGRSSSGCEIDEGPCSDGSLEEEVGDLNSRVQILQDHVISLTERQSDSDERFHRVKGENANLVERLHALEEQLREVEVRSDEKLDEERRRSREASLRLEREREMERENYKIRLESVEKERNSAIRDLQGCRSELETIRQENRTISRQLLELEVSLNSTREETATMASRLQEEREERAREREGNQHLVDTLNQEMGILRQYQRQPKSGSNGTDDGRKEHDALVSEMSFLRSENQRLSETNDELQAQLLSNSLHTGRELLGSGPESLAKEMEVADEHKLRDALREQQEVNRRLRTYIDGILLNIVENYPQLLEVKNNNMHTESPSPVSRAQGK